MPTAARSNGILGRSPAPGLRPRRRGQAGKLDGATAAAIAVVAVMAAIVAVQFLGDKSPAAVEPVPQLITAPPGTVITNVPRPRFLRMETPADPERQPPPNPPTRELPADGGARNR